MPFMYSLLRLCYLDVRNLGSTENVLELFTLQWRAIVATKQRWESMRYKDFPAGSCDGRRTQPL